MTTGTKVVYIAGSGRSGSTVMDTVLGNHPEVNSVGELSHAGRAFCGGTEHCSCGALALNCPFWTAVNEEWTRLSGFSLNGPEWLRLQQRYERFRQLPRLYFQKSLRSSSFQQYTQGITALYQAIQDVSGKSTIVDSSKNPIRAFALSQNGEVDLRLIHLVRDGRGVIWSHLKPYQADPGKGIQKDLAPKPVWQTALDWNFINRLAAVAARQLPVEKQVRVRYEDFVVAPRDSLQAIGAVSELDFAQQASALEEGGQFQAGHTIAGNRVRMGGAIRLQADNSWQEGLNQRQRQLFWVLSGGLAKKFGYNQNL